MISICFVAALAILVSATAPTVDVAKSRMQDNYPAHALQAHEQGTVGVALTVGTDGRAKECLVTRSSGYPDLDKAACEQFTNSVRYKPATDDKGNPIEGKFSTQFTYKLPG
jgi:protein TonB